MTQRFKGRSRETFRFDHKTIPEGYKFWGVCCSRTGYLLMFTPASRTAQSRDEYRSVSSSKILSFVVYLLQPFVTNPRPLQHTLVMDNLFTTKSVNALVRDYNIGLIGTLRHRKGYPSQELRDAKSSLVMYNDGAWDVDENGNLLFKWVDNNIVTMVTSVHRVDDVITRSRRRPRYTNTNRRHVDHVWGDQARVDIDIPRAIDDYNHNMGGVDLFDQLRTYHEQKFRCHRTWMPIFLFALNSLVTNAYICYKGISHLPYFLSHITEMCKDRGDEAKTHRDFILSWCDVLACRARGLSRRAEEAVVEMQRPHKRRRVSTKYPTLPAARLLNLHAHRLVRPQPGKARQRACAYCSYLKIQARNLDQEIPKVRRSTSFCSVCDVHLCQECFQPYHRDQ